MKTDPRIDAYIAAKAEFARPILEHIRTIVHVACPDAGETMKWSMPFFNHKGSVVCGMAAFKAHCALNIWGTRGEGSQANEPNGMGQFGRLTSIADLPPDTEFMALLAARVAAIDRGEKRVTPGKPRPVLESPTDLLAALNAVPAARATFDGFSPSGRRDYVEWVIEAKRDETRAKRIAQSVEWMAEGKPRHWKYQNC